MSDRQAFLRAIRANPDDDTARLAFADWLDEHDEPERAEFIRLQIELEPIRFRIDNPRAVELHAREDALMRQHGGDWTGTDHLLTNPADFGPVFRRGLPERACLSLDTFLASGEALFAAHPTLREVALYGVANRCSELTLSPLLAKLDTLEIADWPTEDDAISLSVSPHLDKIARFKLWLDGEPYFLRELMKQADTRWPQEIELVQVYGGAACRTPQEERARADVADRLGQEANSPLGRRVVRVTRPFERLFPLEGEVGHNIYAGRLPDGKPAVVAGSFGSWLLVTFNDDGRVQNVTVRDSPVRALEGTRTYGEARVELAHRVRDWVFDDLRLSPGVVWVREFRAEEFAVRLLTNQFQLRLANREDQPYRHWPGGEIRGWLEQREFAINWVDYFRADWRGKIHSS